MSYVADPEDEHLGRVLDRFVRPVVADMEADWPGMTAVAEDYLLRRTRHVVRLVMDDDGAVGRIGGQPLLPEGVEWPCTADGTPLTFLLQVDLVGLAGLAVAARLPAGGALFLFVGSDEGADIEHRVIYARGGSGAGPRDAPAPRGGQSPDTARDRAAWRSSALGAVGSVQLPVWGCFRPDDKAELSGIDALGDAFSELYADAIEDANNSLEPEREVARMFGSPYCDWPLGYLETANAREPNWEPVATVAAEWAAEERVSLLFEVDSSDELNMGWWDAGFLQVFILDEDLAAGRFDRTYCTIWSS